MKEELIDKNKNGFKLTIPQHCVSANYDINFLKFGYSRRASRRINPYRLGFKNQYVETHFNLPYEVIAIQEGQKYLNSRMSLYFPEWQSRWYEQHGHNDLDIYIDTQRPDLIDVNIRALASFMEVVSLNIKYDKFDKPCKLTWKVRKIPNHSVYERYIASGKQDKSCYTEETIIADYNVFELYDSQSCKPKFYDGHLKEDFDLTYGEITEQDFESYKKYLEENDDELPENFYQKRKAV